MKKASFCNSLILFLCAFFIVILPAGLSGQQWTQVQRFGTPGSNFVNGVALDAAGNVYVTGSYTSVIDFGTGPLPALGNRFGQVNGFVAKFSAAGVCQWAIYLNCPDAPASQPGMAIATNGTSVYVTGNFGNCLSINGAPPIAGYRHENNGSIYGSSGFGLKLDAATGSTQWITVFGGGVDFRSQALCLDPAGNLYISGYFLAWPQSPVVTFGSYTRTVNGGMGWDAFITRLNGAAGEVSWVSSGGTIADNYSSNSAGDNINQSGIAYVPELNAVVMTGGVISVFGGTMSGRALFSTTGSASTLLLSYGGESGILVVQLNASTGVWTNGVIVNHGSTFLPLATATSAVYDPFTKWVVFSGNFNLFGSLAFGNHPVLTGGDIFYAAYNPATNSFAWAKSATSNDVAFANALAADGLGKIYVTGGYRSTMFAPSAIRSISVTSDRGTIAEEIFLLQLNSLTGNAEMLISPQSVSDGITGNQGNSLAADNTGNVVLAGQLGATTTFPPLPAVTSSAYIDVLLVKYKNAASGPLPVRLQSFTAQRAGSDIILSWHSASEIDHDRFEIERSNDGRSFNTVGQRKALGIMPGSGSYRWTDLSAASRNSGKVFYRLKMVSTTGQVTYSEIVIVYLDKNNNMLMVAASPNPFTNALSLHLNLPEQGQLRISISDISGRKIISRLAEVPAGFSTMTVKETGSLQKGIYTLTLEHNGQQKVMRIVKQ